MNYPKRGQMSEDGKYYTHTDGSVHVVNKNSKSCSGCSLEKVDGCRCSKGYAWTLVWGAYVQTDEVQAACEMAREMIKKCCSIHVIAGGGCCNWCVSWFEKSCPARAYLAAHGQTDAWEVKP